MDRAAVFTTFVAADKAARSNGTVAAGVAGAVLISEGRDAQAGDGGERKHNPLHDILLVSKRTCDRIGTAWF
jgi:hypothetical protein